MSLIDDIRKDREAGTPGPWVKSHDHPNPATANSLACIRGQRNTCLEIASVYGCNGQYGGDMRPEHDARRIARVPDMESALLAAEELAGAVDGISADFAPFIALEVLNEAEDDNGCIALPTEVVRGVLEALTAFRAAIGGTA